MQKLATSPHADRGREEDASASRVRRSRGAPDRANRTLVCSVLFLDIVEYSKKPVSEQLKVKEQFNARVSDAMRDIAVGDRIILDTGDGVAVNFLGDPEDALLVAMNLSQALASTPEREAEVEVRTGVNLGPVRLVRDVSGQPTIIGDGINVAERVMSFARPGQVLVSRSYYETVTRSAEDYARLFAYQGSRTDKHVREHEIYEVAAPASDALDLAQRRHRARPAKRATPIDLAESKVGTSRAAAQKWLGDRALAYGAAVLSVTALAAALVSYVSEPGDTSPAKPAKPSVPKQVELPEPPPPVVVTASPPEVAVAPPQVVAAAPPAPPAASEPVKPSRRGAGQRDSGTRKPSRAAPKARKPTSHALDAPPVHAEAKTAPALPAKAPVAEEPAPASTHTNAKGIAGPTALIMLAVSPWGEVVVDGKSVGVAPPLSELELAPGRYRIEIRNGAFKPYLETFDLEPNQTIRIKYKFKEG